MGEHELYIASQLSRLQVFYGIEVDKDRLKIYVEELRHLTPAQIDAAVKHIKQTWKPSGPNPYPAICDILAAAGATEDDDNRRVVAMVKTALNDSSNGGNYGSVTFNDPALHYTIRAFGGWGRMLDAGNSWWDFNESRFVDTYRAAKKTGVAGPDCLSGNYSRGEKITSYCADGKKMLLANKTTARIGWRGGEPESIATLLARAENETKVEA